MSAIQDWLERLGHARARLMEPSAAIAREDDRQRAHLFQRMVVLVFPLIFLVGIVMMPIVSGASPAWKAPTFLPASSALVISVVSFTLSRVGAFREGMVLYALMFVAAPAMTVIQDASAANLPIGTLMIGGAIVATALFSDSRVSAVFVLFVVAASLLVPVANPRLGFRDAAALIAANLTNGLLVVAYSVYRGAQEKERRGRLEQAYGELREQQELFTSLASNSPGIIFRTASPPDRALRYLSDNFSAITGYPRDGFLGAGARPLTSLVEREDRQRLEDATVEAASSGARYDVEYRIRDATGAQRWMHETGRSVRDGQGKAWLDAIAIDVTDARTRDQQLRQAQRMETVGMLAGGLAHDFNNILTVIISATSLARFTVEHEGALPAAELEETIHLVEDATHRAKGIVDQLLALSRPQNLSLAPVDLRHSLERVRKLLTSSLDKSIRVVVDVPPSDAVALADPVQIEQVILNLCVNAAHAMTFMRPPDAAWGGTLGMTLRRVSPDPAFLADHSEAQRGDHWVVAIQDTGVGIDRESQSQLFTPFFTTKQQGQGTGLGLSMVYSIVKSHHGFVSVYSAPGVGSTFNVFLPAAEAGTVGSAPGAAGREIVRGHGTILVVDDEENVRKLATRILEECGYQVLVAANGEEGVKLFRALTGKVDLVLLDMMMPVMSGREAFYRMREIRPEVRALLASGFRHDHRVQELLDAGLVAFLEKPYTLQSLSLAVSEAMRAQRRG